MSQILTEADILFPHLSNTPNLSSTLSSLRRSTLSTHNRLSSIISDSAFVTSVANAYDLPLVANERCGSWYIPPSHKTGSVYFKSTDGHMGEWGFSLRRLNLQLLDVVEKWGGAVVVDSTRRGKSMPDALSKTIPIWCCVINRAIFGGEGKEKHNSKLCTPPKAVGESEHAQIQGRIDGFVRQFLEICKPNIPHLRSKLQKPLRPIWVTHQSSVPDSPPSFLNFHPIILCTASRRVHGAEASESGYIQGAADDHEAWSNGLTPTLFWENKDLLMSTSEEDAPSVISKLVKEEKGSKAIATLIAPTSELFISPNENVDLAGFDVVISCTPYPFPPSILKDAGVKHYLHLKCQTGKLGSRDLRTQLPRVLCFFSSLPIPSPGKILVCCPTGKDLSVGTALAILCLYTGDEGDIDTSKPREQSGIVKAFVKQRLSCITTSNPALNPSRATLQSVNAVLLESQDPRAFSTSKHTTTLTDRTKPLLAAVYTTPHAPTPDAAPKNNSAETQNPPPDVPTAIFESLQCCKADKPWAFRRTLTSALPTHPSGTVTGTATFTPCTLSASSPPTLLYAEEGEFVTDTGLKFTARRKYVYQLKPSLSDKGEEDGSGKHIVVHFFDDEKLPRASVADGVGEKGEGVGGLFVEMGDLTTSTSSGAFSTSPDEDRAWEAKNREQHLCAEDLYTASWTFGEGMTGTITKGKGGETWWQVRYDVNGPKKDYVSTTRYSRI